MPQNRGRLTPALFVESCAMNDANALDKLDKAILRRLQDNGRETYDVIGEQVGLSPSAVLRRVKRLEDSGVIARYVALVRPEAVGLGLTAYLNVRLEKHTESHKRNPMDLFRASVQTWPEVVECAALQPLHHGYAAQTPQRAGLQNELRAGPGKSHHRRARVTLAGRRNGVVV